MEQILLVDDDVELCELISEYLAPEGFALETRNDGAQGLQAAKTGAYDILVLDVMLPKMGGFEVLRQLRAEENTRSGQSSKSARLPVLMLTARGEDIDRIVGLEMGADDYLPKPFNPRELAARIRAILRRTQNVAANDQSETAQETSRFLQVGDIELDEGARRAARDQTRLELTGVEFDLLAMLLRAAGNVVSRDELTRQVLGRKALPYDRSVDTHISNLRKKLGPDDEGGERITSIRSVGYIYKRPGKNAPIEYSNDAKS